jgi:hypothetical protein
MVQVLEHLPSKHKGLSSNPNIAKKKKTVKLRIDTRFAKYKESAGDRINLYF